MEEIKFIDLKKTSCYNSLRENEVSLHLSGKNRKIVFNQKVTRELQKKNHAFVNVGVGQTTGHVYFVFNNASGYPIANLDKCKTLKLSGKPLIDFLKEHFQVTSTTRFSLSDNKANDVKYSTYVLSLPKDIKVTEKPVVKDKDKKQKKTPLNSAKKKLYFGKLNASVDEILKLNGNDFEDLDVKISGLAKSTINKYGTLNDVYNSNPEELIHKERGIGKMKVTCLQGIFHELGLNWGGQKS